MGGRGKRRKQLDNEQKLAVELKPYQKKAKGRASGVVSDTAFLRQLLAAWEHFPVGPWFEPETARPDGEREVWLWLWLGIDFDLDALAEAAGLDVEDAHRMFSMAKAMRLIYPDGTIDKKAESMLRRRTQPKGTT